MKKFRVLFIFPNMFTPFSFSPAIQILSAVLKENDCDVSLIHIHNRYGIPYKINGILDAVKNYSPNLIGVTATSFEYEAVNRIAKAIKRKFPNIPIILGGSHATIKPEDLYTSSFDGFCLGEGEIPLIKLVTKLKNNEPYYDTESFWFKVGNQIIKNPIGSYVKDLDNLPFFDMEIMDTKKLLQVRNNWLSISASRGCPFRCSFCINPLLKEIAGENVYIRKKSVKNLIKELKNIIQKYGKYIKVINFDDDLLMLYKDWMVKFTDIYKKEIYKPYGIQWVINARVNTLDEVIVKALKESGCREIRMGIETGNKKMREEILNKHITNEEILNAFTLCKKYKINTLAFVMIGIPNETKETILDTLNLLAKIRPTLIRLTFLYPYYGTKIYKYCIQNKLFKSKAVIRDEFTNSVLIFKSLSELEIFRYRLFFPWYLNLRISEKAKNLYEKLIKVFSQMTYEELKKKSTFHLILKTDEQINYQLKEMKIPHYNYFKDNLYYFQYTKG